MLGECSEVMHGKSKHEYCTTNQVFITLISGGCGQNLWSQLCTVHNFILN